MKKYLYLTIVFFVVLHSSTINAQHKQIDEYLMEPPGGVGDIPPPGSGPIPSGIEDFRFINGSTSQSNYFNTAVLNDLLLREMMVKSYANSWYDKQKDLIKLQIESKLNKTFANFDEAKNALFLHSEQGNIARNKIPLKSKYSGLESSGFAKQGNYLRSIKLLEARQAEISAGNINNSQYGYISVNGIALKDLTNVSAVLQQLDIQYNIFESNSVNTHNSKYTNLKLYNLGVEFENYIINLKNIYYNGFGNWDKLNLIQLLLNYEEFKKYTSPPYAIPPELQQFVLVDKAEKDVIENYAISHRTGGYSVFSENYFDQIFQQAWNTGNNMYVDYSDAYYSVRGDWEWQKEIARINLLNGASISDFAIENVLAQLTSLSSNQVTWLRAHGSEADKLNDFLNTNKNGSNASIEAKSFANEIINLMSLDPISDINALNFVLEAFNQNKFSNSFDTNFLSSVNQYTYINTEATDPGIIQLQLYFSTKCAVLRYNNRNWSDAKIYWEASKDIVHFALDGFGMIPVIGEIADLTNGVLYLIEGDGVNATLSFAATVPFVGWGATTGKYVFKITASSLGTKVRLTWKVLQDGIVYFGYSGSKLRKVLGITDASMHAHHLIPWATRNHDLVQKAAKSGNAFHINEALNGIPRLNNLHLTGHSSYNTKILNILDDYNTVINPNATIDEAYTFITGFANYLRTLIVNNPNLNSGQIANLISYP